MNRSALTFAFILVSTLGSVALNSATGAPIRTEGECANVLPADLAVAVGHRFPGANVLTLSQLDPDARAAFVKVENHGCPGVTHLDFFGDKTPAYGILLLTGSGSQSQAHLILASRQKRSSLWAIRTLETGAGPANFPFLGSDQPGVYSDVYGEKTIVAKGEVLVWVQGESVVIVYAWTGKAVDKVWLRD